LMDQQIEDAAMVCGASKVTTLRKVTLPSIRSARPPDGMELELEFGDNPEVATAAT
jgi:hypothetical protein